MGFLDDIISQQSGGGMLGGLPASWQYTNPDSLTPEQKQMMALVGTQNPAQVGFNPLPASTDAFPANGTAPITGLLPSPGQASAAAPTFGAGASPTLFANPPGSTPGNPALPAAAAPVVAADDDEEDAPAPTANASPIGVGGYQMPRIGPAAAFAPNPPATDISAQRRLPAAPVAAPASPGILQHIGAALNSIGAPNSLFHNVVTNPINALITGQTQAETAKSNQDQVANMTARALIAKGVDPQVAIAAVQPGNGEALKDLFKQALTGGTHTQETDKDGNIWDVNKQTGQRTLSLGAKDDKFQHVTIKNPDGSESVQTFNTKTGEFSHAPAASSRSAIDPDLTGQARLDAIKAVNPDRARRIQAMVNGDIQLPTSGQAARSPQAKQDVEDVLAVDGSTSASDFATRAATRRDYASGMASRVTKSLNTTIEHASRLDQAVDKLGNHTYFPGITNYLHDKSGSNWSPEYQKAKSEFESDKEAFVKELDFTLSGGHSSVSGSAELRDKINRADSPEALHAAIQADLHLLSARLDSHTKGFAEGTKSQRDPQDFLYPKNRAAFNKLMGSQDTSTGGAVPGVDNTPAPTAAQPAQQGAPKPGAYTWSPNGGVQAK